MQIKTIEYTHTHTHTHMAGENKFSQYQKV